MQERVKRVPAGGVAVIGKLSAAAKSRLTRTVRGTFARIADAPLTHVVKSRRRDLRALSDQINKAVGTEGVVAPLLTDDDGNTLYPTGSLQVRFREAPSDERLAAFAKRHKVKLRQRNAWAPEQAEFTVRSSDTRYFLDIAAALRGDEDVADAWPDVRAAFRRRHA